MRRAAVSVPTMWLKEVHTVAASGRQSEGTSEPVFKDDELVAEERYLAVALRVAHITRATIWQISPYRPADPACELKYLGM